MTAIARCAGLCLVLLALPACRKLQLPQPLRPETRSPFASATVPEFPDFVFSRAQKWFSPNRYVIISVTDQSIVARRVTYGYSGNDDSGATIEFSIVGPRTNETSFTIIGRPPLTGGKMEQGSSDIIADVHELNEYLGCASAKWVRCPKP